MLGINNKGIMYKEYAKNEYMNWIRKVVFVLNIWRSIMKKSIVLLLSVLLIISGCNGGNTQTPIEEEDEVINEEYQYTGDTYESADIQELPEGELSDVSMGDIFPLRENITWLFSGSYDYSRWEFISDVKEDDEKTLLFIEGEAEDLSGGESGDVSFLKEYQIFKDRIEIKEYDGNKVILKEPLKKGNSWETKNSIMKIIAIYEEEKKILVEERNKSDNKRVNLVLYKVGRGILEEHNYYEDGEFVIAIWLYRYNNQRDKDYLISRYIHPSQSLKPFYEHDSEYYRGFKDTAEKWILENTDLSEAEIRDKYNQIVEDLDPNDIKSISTAKDIAVIFLREVNISGLIDDFKKYYDGVFNSLNIHEYISDNEIQVLISLEPAEYINFNENRELQIKALILYNCGIYVEEVDGEYRLAQKKDYIDRWFSWLRDEE